MADDRRRDGRPKEAGPTQAKLREAEQSYPRIFENLHDTYYRTDAEGRIVLASPSGEKMFGYTPEEVVGMRVAEDFYVRPEERRTLLETLKKLGRIRDFEAKLRRKDGSTIWVSTNATAYTDDEGNVLGVEGIVTDITERKRTVEALRKSEEWHRALIEFGASVYSVLDAEGKILYESPSVQRVYGWRPEELVGKNAFDLIHPDDVEFARKSLSDLLEQPGLVGTAELRHRHKDTSWLTVEVTGVNLLGNPAVAGIVLTSHDVSERKWAEEALRQAKGSFEAFIHDSAFAYIEMDLGGNLTFVNRRAGEISGYAAEEMRGMNLQDLIVPEDLKRAQEDLMLALTEPNTGPREHTIRGKDGNRIDIEVNALPLKKAGKPFGFQLTVADITERKKADRVLRESEEKYRSLVEERKAPSQP